MIWQRCLVLRISYLVTALLLRTILLGIDGIDYRINCYGWPNNRITVEDKVTGLNSIKSFGANGTKKAKRHYMETLERFGVDIRALDHMTTA